MIATTVFIPLAPLFIIFHSTSRERDLRLSVIQSLTAWGFLIAAITEISSLLGAINHQTLAIAWVVASALFAIISYYLVRKYGLTSGFTPSLSAVEAFPAVCAAFLLTAILVTAIWAPPNSWDVMTYHLPRVAHWARNGSVAHYPANVLLQLHHPPWAEFASLQLYILAGGDSYVNLIQWLSAAGCAVTASALARKLGANLAGQMIAALATVSIPAMVMEASGANTDCAAALWLLVFVYFGLEWRESPSTSKSIWAGTALGLALLTKTVTYIYAFPFVVWIILSGARARGWKALATLIAGLLIGGLINTGHYTRNYGLYGSFLGPRSEDATHKYTNDVHTPRAIISNILKNMALHTGMPFDPLNDAVSGGIHWIHSSILKFDITDPATTWGSAFRELDPWTVRNESLSGAPIQSLLIVLIVPVWLIRRYRRNEKESFSFAYFVSLGSAFVIFCALIKWHLFHVRLHIPLFALAAPLIGLAVAEACERKGMSLAISLILFIPSLPFAFANSTRPLVDIPKTGIPSGTIFSLDRMSLYFMENPPLKEPYMKAVEFIQSQGCRDVGFMTGGPGMVAMEYQLWALMGNSGAAFRIESVNVSNESSAIAGLPPFDTFRPCAIFYLYPRVRMETVHGVSYDLQFSAGPVSVFRARQKD